MSKQEEIKQALAGATPGPWEYNTDSVIKDGKTICHMFDQKEYDFDNAEENAYLVANAPEYIAYLLRMEQSLQEDIMVLKDMVHTKKEENERLRKALNEINDAKGEFSGIVCRVIARKALGQEGEEEQS